VAWPSEAGAVLGLVAAPRRRTVPPRRRSRVVQVHGRGRFYKVLRGRYRIFGEAVYRFFRSRDGPPAEGDPPWTTSGSLPHEPADTFADGTWYLAVSYFNGVFDSGFLAIGEDGATYRRLDVSGGAEETSPPADPLDVRLEPRAGGIVRVHAVCARPSSDPPVDWAIGYTTDGSTPPADAPDVTEAMAGRVAVLRYDLPAQGDGTTITVRVQTRRNDGTNEVPDWTYSDGVDPKVACADAAGPDAPETLTAWPGRLE